MSQQHAPRVDRKSTSLMIGVGMPCKTVAHGLALAARCLRQVTSTQRPQIRWMRSKFSVANRILYAWSLPSSRSVSAISCMASSEAEPEQQSQPHPSACLHELLHELKYCRSRGRFLSEQQIENAVSEMRRITEQARDNPISAPFDILAQNPSLKSTLTGLIESGNPHLFYSSHETLIALDPALNCGGNGSLLTSGAKPEEALITQTIDKYPKQFTYCRFMETEDPQLDASILRLLEQRLSSKSPKVQRNAFISLFNLIARKPYLVVPALRLKSLNRSPLTFSGSTSRHWIKMAWSYVILKTRACCLSVECAKKHLISNPLCTRSEKGGSCLHCTQANMPLRLLLLCLAIASISEKDWEEIQKIDGRYEVELTARAIFSPD